MTCLGCGGVVCQVCEDRARKVIEMSHWPLETSISRAALAVLEQLIRQDFLGTEPHDTAVSMELANVANIIRAHLQHHPAPVVQPFYDAAATMADQQQAPAAVSIDEDWLT